MKFIFLIVVSFSFAACMKDINSDYELNVLDTEWEGEWFQYHDHFVDTIILVNNFKQPDHKVKFEIINQSLIDNVGNFYIRSISLPQADIIPVIMEGDKAFFTVSRRGIHTHVCWQIDVSQTNTKNFILESNYCQDY